MHSVLIYVRVYMFVIRVRCTEDTGPPLLGLLEKKLLFIYPSTASATITFVQTTHKHYDKRSMPFEAEKGKYLHYNITVCSLSLFLPLEIGICILFCFDKILSNRTKKVVSFQDLCVVCIKKSNPCSALMPLKIHFVHNNYRIRHFFRSNSSAGDRDNNNKCK